jgi:acetolactate synthase I/II/III large subunit
MQSSVYEETATPRTKDRGADLFVALLRAQGVQQVMALTGGAIMEGMDALQAAEHLDMYIFQTEPGAAWAAMGYARTTGQVGVCVVTSGPGATNTITAIADAQRDNVPLVIITGQVPTAARNTDAFQETNIVEIAAPTAKKVFYLNRPEDMPAVVSEAFRIATQGRPGPVLIDLTKDAQQARVHASAFPTADAPELTASSAPAQAPVDAALDDVATLLRQAERPVIIAGYGVMLAQAQRELQQLLQVVPCPVVHTLPGKAALPTAHPCNYGMLGMHGFYVSNWIVHHADVVVSLGSRYDDRITGDPQRFAPAAKRLVHFDIDPEQITKVLPGRKLGVVGDLKAALVALHRRLEGAPLDFPRWRHAITGIVKQYPSTYARRPEWLQAQYTLEVLNDVVQQQVTHTGQQVTYTTEVGDHQMWAGQYVALQDGWQFITSSGQGAMGSGLPMAIGAQMAHPASLVICLAGDGSMRFSEAELETIWEYDLPVKTLVFNNDGYGIVRMWNHRFYEGRETGVIKRHKDWTLLARGNGFDAVCVDRVTEPAHLAAVLRRALSHRHPHFIELVTPYEECLPLMPPGQSFDEMIL